MKNSPYKQQVELLLEVLPFVAMEKCFALKGGTAINLFVRDMPRLSVDIDLTYLGDEAREEALKKVAEALHRIKAAIEKNIKKVKVFGSKRESQATDIKLFIERGSVQIKIEASPVIRGTILPVADRPLVASAADMFETAMDVPVVNLGDLYGGKIVAAMDRQHPRDLFDVKLLFENEGITEDIKNGFVTYLLSHKRPFHEVLRPTLVDQTLAHENQFVGMTDIKFEYGEFEDIRKQLITDINKKLTSKDQELLVSFALGAPKWELASIAKMKDLPAVNWKLMNINKLSESKRQEMAQKLRDSF